MVPGTTMEAELIYICQIKVKPLCVVENLFTYITLYPAHPALYFSTSCINALE